MPLRDGCQAQPGTLVKHRSKPKKLKNIAKEATAGETPSSEEQSKRKLLTGSQVLGGGNSSLSQKMSSHAQ